MKKWLIIAFLIIFLAGGIFAYFSFKVKKNRAKANVYSGLEDLSREELKDLVLPEEQVMGAMTSQKGK